MPSGLQSHPALGENTKHIWLLQLELWKSAQQKARRWQILWAHLRGKCYCHLLVPLPWLEGGIGLHSVAFKEISETPGCLGIGKVMLHLGYSPSCGSYIFSALHRYGHAHSPFLNHVPAVAIQLLSKVVMGLSLLLEFSSLPRYHILFFI